MKLNYLLIFTAVISTSLLAQQATNPPASTPLETAVAASPATNAPTAAKTNSVAAKAEKKKTAKKKSKSAAKKKDPATELRTVPLMPGPAVVIASNVNVRGQAKLNSEVITRLTRNEPVTVIEEVRLLKSGPDEPSAWAKILMPATAHVWVSAGYIDPTNKIVTARKLNLRGGPGENYSVVGVLLRGDEVKEVSTRGDWMEIKAPASAYAFMAAQYLRQEPAGAWATTSPQDIAPTPTPVAEPPSVAPAPTEVPTTPPIAEVPGVTNVPAPAVAEEPPPKRIVQREGIVWGTFSIQSPTRFALVSPENHKTNNYLHTISRNLDLSRYKGLRIVVTGEEGLDERWRNTPIITIQKIQVVD